MKSPQQEKRHQVTLRIPKEVDKVITETAKKMGISKNAYIIMVLNQFVRERTA